MVGLSAMAMATADDGMAMVVVENSDAKIRWMRRSVAGRAPARQKVRWVEVVDDGQTTQSSQR